MSAATIVTEASFEAEVLESPRPVLVDVWADWCPPCRMVAPVVDAIAAGQQGKLKLVMVNADEQPAVTRRYGIMSLPTLLLFVDGVEKLRLVGARPKPAIMAELAQFLG
jgi:thioredoxin 1